VPRYGAPHGCRCTRTFLGAPPTPRFGVSEARLQTPGAKCAAGTRWAVDIVSWNHKCGATHERGRCHCCPLPLRERAARCCHARGWVRGTCLKQTPHPFESLGRPLCPLPQGERAREPSAAHLRKANPTNPFGSSPRKRGPIITRRWLWVSALAALGRDDDRLVCAKHQLAGVRNDRRRNFIVSGLLFTMTFATPTCRLHGALKNFFARRHASRRAAGAAVTFELLVHRAACVGAPVARPGEPRRPMQGASSSDTRAQFHSHPRSLPGVCAAAAMSSRSPLRAAGLHCGRAVGFDCRGRRKAV
jgi:hypothetical protein